MGKKVRACDNCDYFTRFTSYSGKCRMRTNKFNNTNTGEVENVFVSTRKYYHCPKHRWADLKTF